MDHILTLVITCAPKGQIYKCSEYLQTSRKEISNGSIPLAFDLLHGKVRSNCIEQLKHIAQKGIVMEKMSLNCKIWAIYFLRRCRCGIYRSTYRANIQNSYLDLLPETGMVYTSPRRHAKVINSRNGVLAHLLLSHKAEYWL